MIEMDLHFGATPRHSWLMAGVEVADFENGTLEACYGPGPKSYRSSYARSPMNTALIDHYRCPDDYVGLTLKGWLSDDNGYFRFGQDSICYGRLASGFQANRADAVLYDVLNDVTTRGSNVFCLLTRRISLIICVLSITRTASVRVP